MWSMKSNRQRPSLTALAALEATELPMAGGRDLVPLPHIAPNIEKPVDKDGSPYVVFGNPDFNAGGADQPTGGGKLFDFTPLPGAEKEARQIVSIIGSKHTKLFLGGNAGAADLMSIVRPTLLHIATHGFFLDNQDIIAPSAIRGLKVKHSSTSKASVTPLRPPVANPLLQSGLAFAGANTSGPDGVTSARWWC